MLGKKTQIFFCCIISVEMLIETSISSSIEAGLFCVSEHRKLDSLCDWKLGDETWQMSPKCDDPSLSGCKGDEYPCRPLPRTGSEQSSVSVMSECPVPAFVYNRRKKQQGGGGSSSSADTAVGNFCAKAPVNSKRSGDCVSVVSSDASVAVMEQNVVSQAGQKNIAVREVVIALPCSRDIHIKRHKFTNGCYGVNDRSSVDVHRTVMQKTIDVDSINDSCSSSKSNMELALASVKGEMDENGECSSSVISDEVVREDLSEKDILRNQGNAEVVGPSRTHVTEEIGTNGDCSSCFRFCKICGRSGTTPKMLICDNCEEAFHVRCCNPRIRELPVDEWYCISCMKKKRIMLKEAMARKSSSITGGMGRCRDVSPEEEFSPIEFMLRDDEPYRTSVRVGKGFQAEVPDWSGPIDKYVP